MTWVIIFVVFGLINIALVLVPPLDMITFLNAFVGAYCIFMAIKEWKDYKKLR